MAASTKTTVPKKAPATKKPKSHPPYAEMVKEAIVSLKERTGSSQYAIAKHIEDHQKDLPANYKKMLLVQLKKLVAAGKLVKVKNSFKVASGVVEKPKKLAAEKKRAPVTTAKKAPAAVKKSSAPAKAKSVKKVKTPVKAKKAAKKTLAAKKPKSIKSPMKKTAPKKKAAAKK
ncbi:histone H1-like [Rutidosis leptorrhynchoides]|uniref:histone H1-like n=1 Tax=Rutidosis leptorrhynchoides TaxID=125765 RepID=UPI003A98FE71